MNGPLSFLLALLIALLCTRASGQDVSVAEVATQEQIRSASCAMSAMPKQSLETLIVATRRYMTDKNPIEVVRAFEIDDVPKYIAKCFDIHARLSLAQKKSDRQFANFYDGAERALRLHVVIEIARRGNQSTDTIRRLNDQMYETLMRFNRENP